MSSNFIQQGVQLVSEAIKADNDGNYSEALNLYKRSLEYFMTGLKYEQNPAARDTIMRKVTGYMKRAEDLKNAIDGAQGSGGAAPPSGATATAAAPKNREDAEKKNDEDQAKIRGALSGAIVTEKPNVSWDDVAGLEGAKEALKEAVILPARFPQLFTGKRRPWKGILLYGPPGTGKSYLAKAVATEADATFFAVSSSDLVSKWQGESERLVRNLFEMAREANPAIIFIDEIDSLCSSRSEGESESARRIKTEFLVQMQGVSNSHDGILVLGATNVPWELDPAMRRRFEKRIYIPLPEPHARQTMFRLHLGDTPNSLSDDDFDRMGNMSDGYSGSDIAVVVREALMQPLRHCQTARQFCLDEEGMYMPCTEYPSCPRCPIHLHNSSEPTARECPTCHAVRMTLMEVPPEKLKVPVVTPADFESALGRAHSSVAPEELERFIEWTETFGSEGA